MILSPDEIATLTQRVKRARRVPVVTGPKLKREG